MFCKWSFPISVVGRIAHKRVIKLQNIVSNYFKDITMHTTCYGLTLPDKGQQYSAEEILWEPSRISRKAIALIIIAIIGLIEGIEHLL